MTLLMMLNNSDYYYHRKIRHKSGCGLTRGKTLQRRLAAAKSAEISGGEIGEISGGEIGEISGGEIGEISGGEIGDISGDISAVAAALAVSSRLAAANPPLIVICTDNV